MCFIYHPVHIYLMTEEFIRYDIGNSLQIPMDPLETKFLDDIQKLTSKPIEWCPIEYPPSTTNYNFNSVDLCEIDGIYRIERIDINEHSIIEIPSSISDMRNIEVLKIHFHSIDSMIEVSKLQSLKFLSMNSCNIHIIPPSIGELSNLVHLSLVSNKIEVIPLEMGKLSNLQYLNLSDNRIKNIPEVIRNLRHLEKLHLSRNEIEHLPDVFDSIKNLKFFDLSFNKISRLPDSYFRCVDQIRLSNNRVEKINFEEKMDHITSIWLDNNQLEEFPDNIDNLSNLSRLILSNNNLIALPESLGNLSLLEELMIRNNKIKRLPDKISNCTNLKILYAENNNLSSLPDDIGKLTRLKKVDISGNNITKIPESIKNLKELNCFITDVTDPQELKKLPFIN